MRVTCPRCKGISFKTPVGERAQCPLCKYIWLPDIPFNNDWIFNQNMQGCADSIYKGLWVLQGIERNLGALDKERSIDVKLTLESGLTIDIQEKFRRAHYKEYWQFTVEYKNNPITNEPGEFYKLAANYYFYGYVNKKEDSFTDWWLIDLNVFKNLYADGTILHNYILQNEKRSNASALCFNFKNPELQRCFLRHPALKK